MLASSVVDHGFKSRSDQAKRLENWYFLLLCESRNITEKEQRMVDSGIRIACSSGGICLSMDSGIRIMCSSGGICLSMDCSFIELAL